MAESTKAEFKPKAFGLRLERIINKSSYFYFGRFHLRSYNALQTFSVWNIFPKFDTILYGTRVSGILFTLLWIWHATEILNEKKLIFFNRNFLIARVLNVRCSNMQRSLALTPLAGIGIAWSFVTWSQLILEDVEWKLKKGRYCMDWGINKIFSITSSSNKCSLAISYK